MRGMWKHLERLGGGRGAMGAGVGTRGPGESQLESDRRMARRRITLLKRRLETVERQRADAPQAAHALADARRRARRLHERRQVDAPERAHRRRRVRREPPLRDARPDDARLRARRPPLPRHRHRRLHPPPADAARRGVRGDARGDARRRPDPARARRVRARRAARRSRSWPSRRSCTRSARTSSRSSSCSTRSTPSTRCGGGGSRTRTRTRSRSRRATGDGLDELKHRIAERFADRFEPVRLLVPYDAGDVLAELYALGAPIEERRDTEEGVLVRARLTGAALRRFAPYLVAGAERAGTTRTAS